MFQGCTSLTDYKSILEPLQLTTRCYAYMFAGCTKLTSIPVLKSTFMAPACYASMFEGCESLTSENIYNLKIEKVS
jgi:hypothetical protein